jgi:hypothetical protein
MGMSLGNQLAQDDVAIIARNPAVHLPGLDVFRMPYWTKGFSPDLYRPFATLSFGLQWLLGGGEAWPVHLTSLLLYCALTLAVWGLARRLMPALPAWVTAAVFAVHPMHVEAVATGVNQAELLVALILTLCTCSYIDGRREAAFGVRRAVGIALAFAMACLYKEHAVVLPGLLLAAELTVLSTARRPGADLRLLVLLYASLVLVTGAFLLLRTMILGNFAGSFTAEGLIGLGLGGRTVTMLGVVPIWLRLLVWPAHLQADYSPGEIVGTITMGAMQWTGLLIVLAAIGSAIALQRRIPAWSFGILWFAAAILPVANILIPTGIVLAERTLLLPSVGLIVGGGGLVSAMTRGALLRPAARRGAIWLLTLVLTLGVLRSALRMQVWNSTDYLWLRTLEDAPLSYRAHHNVAQWLLQRGQRREAEMHYRRAIELYPRAFQTRFDLADQYRFDELCEPAIPLYEDGLAIAAGRSDARLSLIACLLWDGRYEYAKHQARIGRGWGVDDAYFVLALALADSAARSAAPAHTVRIPLPDSTRISEASVGSASASNSH